MRSQDAAPPKKPYDTPKLVVYGKIVDLTQRITQTGKIDVGTFRT